MCLTRAAEVLAVQGDQATVRWNDHVATVDTSLVGPLLPGEHVLVHAGLALERVAEDEQQALDIVFAELDGAVERALASYTTTKEGTP